MKQYFVVFFISMVDVCVVVIGRPFSIEFTFSDEKKISMTKLNCLYLWSPYIHKSLGFQVFHLSKQFLGLSLVLIVIKFQVGREQNLVH